MIKYIEDNDIDLFHDFMDMICKQKADWFNMLASISKQGIQC